MFLRQRRRSSRHVSLTTPVRAVTWGTQEVKNEVSAKPNESMTSRFVSSFNRIDGILSFQDIFEIQRGLFGICGVQLP